jgi:hypothetical protein
MSAASLLEVRVSVPLLLSCVRTSGGGAEVLGAGWLSPVLAGHELHCIKTACARYAVSEWVSHHSRRSGRVVWFDGWCSSYHLDGRSL